MSTAPAPAGAATADRNLFTRLLDDAAVFPPGSAPLAAAVRAHARYRSSPWSDVLGPLLLPPSSAADLVGLAADVANPRNPLRVALAARPGTDPTDVRRALTVLTHAPHVEVVAVEVAWAPGWRADRPPALPLVLELPRGRDQVAALDDLAEGVPAADESDRSARGPVAKFRTGATATWPWPDEAELAGVLRAVVGRGLRLKLTGGLHHAVRGTHVPGGGAEGPPEEQHGLLNVLLATHRARGGADVAALAPVLAGRDADPLRRALHALTPAEVAGVRATFASYGCCGVTDPVRELTDLHLLDPRPADR